MFGPHSIHLALPFEGMLEANCVELSAEGSGFGEELVYRECQRSFLDVERPESGQLLCGTSSLTQPPQS